MKVYSCIIKMAELIVHCKWAIITMIVFTKKDFIDEINEKKKTISACCKVFSFIILP